MSRDPTLLSLDLRGRIALRKEEAEKKRFKDKGPMVARVLGRNTWSNGENHQFVFKRNSFLIDYGHGVSKEDRVKYSYVEILYAGRLVFHFGDSEILAFIPGEWEDEFEALFKEAYKKGQEVDDEMVKVHEQEMTARTEAEAQKWGLK